MQDEMIVALYWKRDEKAISETERKYGRYLSKIAYNILSDWEDSKETVNDTYLKAWNSMPTHKPGVLSTYLGKITRQLSIDAFRTRNRDKRKHSEYAVSLSELEDCISGSETTEQSVELKLLAEAINTYSYGDLLGMIEFYDAENLVFYDGTSYADHCQLKLIKTVPAPTIQTSMTAPNYNYEKTPESISSELWIPLLADKYTAGSGANNPDFVALSDTIRILEGSRNSVPSSSSTKFYQPYQINADIKFDWSTSAAAYTGDAPYGWYKDQPYAPFYLTEYKFNGSTLEFRSDRTTARAASFSSWCPDYHCSQRR